jgi:hypothetical protein
MPIAAWRRSAVKRVVALTEVPWLEGWVTEDVSRARGIWTDSARELFEFRDARIHGAAVISAPELVVSGVACFLMCSPVARSHRVVSVSQTR